MIKRFFNRLTTEWDDFWYKYSDERIALAKERLALHQKNMAPGGNGRSPYIYKEDMW